MKVLKKSVMLLVLMVTVISTVTTVKADEFDKNETDVASSKLIEENQSTITLEGYTKGQILNKGTASVTNNGGGSVNVYGAVFGSVVCDKMILELTLQRYSNGSWINVKSFSNTAYNTSLLTKSYNVSVAKGYYYRVKAACVAQKGGISESKMPITDGILIN